jgi:hypothetical protein
MGHYLSEMQEWHQSLPADPEPTCEQWSSYEKRVVAKVKRLGECSMRTLADHPPRGVTGRNAERCAMRLVSHGVLALNENLRLFCL